MLMAVLQRVCSRMVRLTAGARRHRMSPASSDLGRVPDSSGAARCASSPCRMAKRLAWARFAAPDLARRCARRGYPRSSARSPVGRRSACSTARGPSSLSTSTSRAVRPRGPLRAPTVTRCPAARAPLSTASLSSRRGRTSATQLARPLPRRRERLGAGAARTGPGRRRPQPATARPERDRVRPTGRVDSPSRRGARGCCDGDPSQRPSASGADASIRSLKYGCMRTRSTRT